MITFVMPAPPSVNNLYRNVRGRGRVKTKTYRDWMKRAVTPLSYDAPQEVINDFTRRVVQRDKTTRYAVSITAAVGYQRDLDNILKPVLDALVDNAFITDDRYIDRIEIEREAVRDFAQITVTLTKGEDHA